MSSTISAIVVSETGSCLVISSCCSRSSGNEMIRGAGFGGLLIAIMTSAYIGLQRELHNLDS